MTHPGDAVTRRAWFDLIPDDTSTADGTTVRFALMALAHTQAFSERIETIFGARDAGTTTDQEFADAIRDNNRANLMPYIAAYTAAALAKGWTPQEAHRCLEHDPQLSEELLCDWVTAAGIDPWSIASADDPMTTGHGLTNDDWKRIRSATEEA